MNEYNDYMIPMFSVPLLHLQVRDWENKKSKLLDIYSSIQSNSKTLQYNDVNTDYHYNFNNQNSYSVEIESILDEELAIVEQEFGCKVVMGNSWFEKAEKNGFHRTHNHGPMGLSSVCFVEYDEKYHKPTHFLTPLLFQNGGCEDTFIPEDAKEGSIMFWPSALMHYTEPNKSEIPRLVLSFNLESHYEIHFSEIVDE